MMLVPLEQFIGTRTIAIALAFQGFFPSRCKFHRHCLLAIRGPSSNSAASTSSVVLFVERVVAYIACSRRHAALPSFRNPYRIACFIVDRRAVRRRECGLARHEVDKLIVRLNPFRPVEFPDPEDPGRKSLIL